VKGRELMNTVHDSANPRNHSAPKSDSGKAVLKARGRLSDAKKYFEYRGWNVLPQGIRGQRILQWGAAMAYLAAEKDPERSARNWCRLWAPWLKPHELRQLIATIASPDFNMRWSDDECAAVLDGITLRVRIALGLRFIGCVDDPNYELRNGLRREKAAARSRRCRAARSTGAKGGRPPLQLSEEDRLARRRAQASARKRAERERKKAAMGVTLNPVRDITLNNSNSSNNPIGGVTGFSVTDLPHDERPAESRAPEAPRPPHRPIIVRLDDVPDGMILDQDGNEFKPPPPYQRRPAPKDWMEAAFEGMNRGCA
jgi:hypothetical protein